MAANKQVTPVAPSYVDISDGEEETRASTPVTVRPLTTPASLNASTISDPKSPSKVPLTSVNVMDQVSELVNWAKGQGVTKRFPDGFQFVENLQAKMEEAELQISEKEGRIRALGEENQSLRDSIAIEVSQVNVVRVRRKLEALQNFFESIVWKMEHEPVDPNEEYEVTRKKDVEHFKSEVSELFGKVSIKLKKWEITQLEMVGELESAQKVLDKLNGMVIVTEQLKGMRKDVVQPGSKKRKAPPALLPLSAIPLPGSSTSSSPPPDLETRVDLSVQYQQFQMDNLIDSLTTLDKIPLSMEEKSKRVSIIAPAVQEQPEISPRATIYPLPDRQITNQTSVIQAGPSVIMHAPARSTPVYKEYPRTTTYLPSQLPPVPDQDQRRPVIGHSTPVLPAVKRAAPPPIRPRQTPTTTTMPPQQTEPVDLQTISPTTSKNNGQNVCGLCGMSFKTIVQMKLHHTVVHSKEKPAQPIKPVPAPVMPTPEPSYHHRVLPSAPTHPPFRHAALLDKISSVPQIRISPYEFTSEPQPKRHCQRISYPQHYAGPAQSPSYSYGHRTPQQSPTEMPYSIARYVGLEGPYSEPRSNGYQYEDNMHYTYYR